MMTQFKTREEFRDIDLARDRFRNAVPDPARRRERLADFVLREVLPAERALLARLPADDRAGNADPPPAALEQTAGDLLGLSAADAAPTLADLGRLSRHWNGDPAFRTVPAPLLAGGEPAEDPAYLAEFLSNTLAWFDAEATGPFHPVEKYGLLSLRLADLRPFPAWNVPLARIAPWTQLLAADYPPPVLAAGEGPAWFDALAEAREGRTESWIRLQHAGIRASFRLLFVFLGLEEIL